MLDINKIILVGRLGADPIQRETKNGAPVVNFPLATAYRTRVEGDGVGAVEGVESKQETQWHRVVAWGRQAETCAQFLKKGAAVYVEGRLLSHKYQSKEGEERTSYEVHADQVSFLGEGRKAALVKAMSSEALH